MKSYEIHAKVYMNIESENMDNAKEKALSSLLDLNDVLYARITDTIKMEEENKDD